MLTLTQTLFVNTEAEAATREDTEEEEERLGHTSSNDMLGFSYLQLLPLTLCFEE